MDRVGPQTYILLNKKRYDCGNEGDTEIVSYSQYRMQYIYEK